MNFFRRKDLDEKLDVTFEEQLAEQQVAPGTQLHYDSRLIARLLSQHADLLKLLSKAMESVKASRFEETKKHVHNLRLLLNEHLPEVKLRLYTYLNCCLKADSEGLDLVRTMRRELADMSRKAMRFVNHYESIGISLENKAAFVEELVQVTFWLSDRFAREERLLYTMYQPPQSYADSAVQPDTVRNQPAAGRLSLVPAC